MIWDICGLLLKEVSIDTMEIKCSTSGVNQSLLLASLTLKENKYGGIWILTKKDLTLYHEGTFETKISFNDTNISIDHMKIIGDENWFFTNKGVYTYARKKGVFNKIQIVPNTNFKYSFINNTGISTALLDPEKNQLWICTANKGVYTKKSGKPLKPYLLEPNESQSINNIIVKKNP